jgi:hypothetical protein
MPNFVAPSSTLATLVVGLAFIVNSFCDAQWKKRARRALRKKKKKKKKNRKTSAKARRKAKNLRNCEIAQMQFIFFCFNLRHLHLSL